MHIPWEDLQLLLAVLEAGSFSAAARRLTLTQPTVSRRVAGLEERLGCALFVRNVEGVQLTAQATALVPALEQMARAAAELERATAGLDAGPSGDVRLAAPPGVAYELLVPFAERLRERLPGVSLRVIAGVDRLDLSRGEADIAIRNFPPSQPDLEVVLQGQVPYRVCAAAKYAAKLPSPCRPEDLDWIAWAYPNEHLEPNPWLARTIADFKPRFASNDYLVQLRALALGLGAMVLPRARHAGQPYPPPVELELTVPWPPAQFYVVCAKSVLWVARVRAVLAELVATLRAVEGLTLSTC
jgi:DNA-binding transcriptional LysR family regulator